MLYLLVLVSLIALVYYYFTRTFNFWKDNNVVGPTPTFFFGNIKDQVLRRTNSATVMRRIYEQYPDEKVVGIYRMTTPCLMLRDLDVIKHIMIKDFDLFVDRGVEFSESGLGVNIFHTDGDKWRILRNRFTPIFTSGKLKSMLYLITERGDKFLEYVGGRCDKQAEQPIHLIVQKFTMSTIAACAFGIELDENMSKTLERIDSLIFTANYSHELDMMYPGILKKFNGSIFPTFVTEFFYDLSQRVIQQRGGKPTNRKDFMDMILELRQEKEVTRSKRFDGEDYKSFELTDSVIAAQAFVFFAAGYETSASTMTYLLYELAINPDIQDKLIAEIDEGLKRHNGDLSYELISELTYLDNVFDETLRKHPLIDPLQRNASTDYKVPGTDITIKKGQTVIVSPWGIHHDPKNYPNPEKFDPSRFSSDAANNRHSCAYLPFGVGPRNCIGMRFAKVQSKVCIIKLLSKFRVEPSKNTASKLKYDPMRLVIFPAGGVLLNVVRRNV